MSADRVLDPVAEIRRLYFSTTKATIQRDVARAIALLKTLPTEEERQRAAVFMDGLSAMRSEWYQKARMRKGKGPGAKGKGT
jgi:hypothetical protein